MAVKKKKDGTIKDTKINKKKLKEKLWGIFSTYIRLRDKGRCVTCGHAQWDSDLGEWSIKGMHAGHFHHGVLDEDEENINCQCNKCNTYLGGNLSKYSVYLLQKLGYEKFVQLAYRANQAKRGEFKSIEDYQKLIKEYQTKCENLRTSC